MFVVIYANILSGNMIIYLIIYLFAIIVALAAGLLASWSDLRGMTIPNTLVVFIGAAFIAAVAADLLAEAEVFTDLLWHFLAGFLVFAVTAGMFFMKIIGGGDSKLLSVYALWAGMSQLMILLFCMASLGALVGVAALVLKKRKPFKNPREGSWVARVQGGESVVPYGIPITIGAFIVFINAGYLSPETLSAFL